MSLFLRFFSVILSLVLSACGGGGDGASNTGAAVGSPSDNPSAQVTSDPNYVSASAVGIDTTPLENTTTTVAKSGVQYTAVPVLLPYVSLENFVVSIESGVATVVQLGSDAKTAYVAIDTANLAEGAHFYTLRYTDKKTGKFTLVEVPVQVKSPSDANNLNLTSAGASVALLSGEKLTFSTNNLNLPTSVDVVTIPLANGTRYEIRSASPLNAQGVKVQLPKGKKGSDPYGVQSPAGSGNLLDRLKAAINNLTQSIKSAPALTADPYLVKSTHPAGLQPLFEKGLGQVVRQGDEVPFESGLDALYSQRFWDPNVAVSLGENSGLNIFELAAYDAARYLAFDVRPAWELQTVIQGNPKDYDWSQSEPVLFIHGFAPSLGGGKGTWGSYPKLAMQTKLPNGNALVPFEFHWYPGQSFRLAADDLADAIDYIYKATGSKRKVHIVAHSFGGVLTRTVLQNLSKSPDRHNRGSQVASVISVGSPYSGIKINDSQVPEEGVYLPRGMFINPDVVGECAASGPIEGALESLACLSKLPIIPLCRGVTCWEMGAPRLVNFSQQRAEEFGLTGGYATKGYHAVQLNKTTDSLPDLQYLVGIGLAVAKQSDAFLVEDGDYLISFAGQRFNATTDDAAKKNPLLKDAPFGQAKVTEVILGMNPDARPGLTLSAAQLPSGRDGGYYHSSTTGSGNWFGSDEKFGLMAAPKFDCETEIKCTHAGYQLMKLMHREKLAIRPINFTQINTDTPIELVIAQPANANFNATQQAAINAMLATAKGRGLVSGQFINWALLSDAERIAEFNKLSSIPDSARVIALSNDLTAQQAQLSAYFTEEYRRANLSSTLIGLFGKDTRQGWLDVVDAAVKSSIGVLQIAWTPAALVSEGVTVVTAWTPNAERALGYIKRLDQLGKITALLANCPDLLGPYQAALRQLNNQIISEQLLSDAVLIPLECMSAILSSSGRDKQSFIVDALSGGVSLSGTPLSTAETLQIYSDLIGTSLSLMPKAGGLMKARGVINLLGGWLDAYIAGQQFANKADEVYYIEMNLITEASRKLDAALREEFNLMRLIAKTAPLYKAQSFNVEGAVILADLNLNAGVPNRLSVRGLPAEVVRVRVSFTNGLASQMLSVANGSSSEISLNFSNAGNVTVMFSYLNASGALLGTQSQQWTICPAGQTLEAGVCVLPLQAPVIASAIRLPIGGIKVTGTVASGTRVNVLLPDGSSVIATSDSNGNWQANSPTEYAVGSNVSAQSQRNNTFSANVSRPVGLQFNEVANSNWRLRLDMTKDTTGALLARFDFQSLGCSGKLSFVGKDASTGAYRFKETHETGTCVKTCDILLASNLATYQEQCFGGAYGTTGTITYTGTFDTPTYASGVLDSVLGSLNSTNLLLGASVTDSCANCPIATYGNTNSLTNGNLSDGRNLGTYSGSFNILLASPITLDRLILYPYMSPNGTVSYEIQTSTSPTGASGTWTSHGIKSGTMADKVPFPVLLGASVSDVRIVKVIIHSSPSWVAFSEIEGFLGASSASRVPPISLLAGTWHGACTRIDAQNFSAAFLELDGFSSDGSTARYLGGPAYYGDPDCATLTSGAYVGYAKINVVQAFYEATSPVFGVTLTNLSTNAVFGGLILKLVGDEIHCTQASADVLVAAPASWPVLQLCYKKFKWK
jgi:pimeloyl-ACP methyl ester carboxylesterase